MREEEEVGWGGDYGRRKQERGSVRCSEVGTELKSEESAVTRLLDGQLDMFSFCYGVMLFLVNLISNHLARSVSMKHVGSCQAALIFQRV